MSDNCSHKQAAALCVASCRNSFASHFRWLSAKNHSRTLRAGFSNSLIHSCKIKEYHQRSLNVKTSRISRLCTGSQHTYNSEPSMDAPQSRGHTPHVWLSSLPGTTWNGPALCSRQIKSQRRKAESWPSRSEKQQLGAVQHRRERKSLTGKEDP